ncbi:MAG: MFS transporter [Candidatus Omnitrophica bacterium]|nr:MFS transporter [Candidatus Omnitrophota bacterium]
MNVFTVIYLASFLMACVNYILNISLALFLAQVKQAGPFIIGLAGFTGNVAFTAGTLLLARYSQRKKTSVFIYVPAGIALLYLLIRFSPMPLIFLFLFIAGALYAFFWPAVQRCFKEPGDELHIGIYNLAWSGGVICGAFSAGMLYALNYTAPFITAFILSACAFFLIVLSRAELLALNKYSEKEESEKRLPAETVKEVRLLNFLHFFAASSIFFLYPKLGLERGFSPQFIGSAAGILLICRFVVFSLLIDKPMIMHPARFIISCFLFFVSCCLTGLGGQPYAVIAGVAILGASGAVSYHNSLLMHIKHGLKTEIHESIIGMGALSGALVTGLLGQILNLPVAFVLVGAGILLAGVWHSRKYLSRR